MRHEASAATRSGRRKNVDPRTRVNPPCYLIVIELTAVDYGTSSIVSASYRPVRA